MIDTIRCALSGRVDLSALPEGWGGGITENTSLQSGDSRCLWFLSGPDALRLGGALAPDGSGVADWAEVSLPRLLHGSNSYLLRAAELPEALSELDKRLSALGVRRRELRRVDVVSHHICTVPVAIQGLSIQRHPRIHAEPAAWFGQSVQWVGRERVLRAYDKRQEAEGVPGEILRCESQLRGRALPCRVFDLGTLWAAHRELWAAFEPVCLQRAALSLAEFLALLEAEGCAVRGVPAVAYYLAHRVQRQQRNLRRQIAAARRNLRWWSIADDLQGNEPVEYVDAA